MTRKDSSLIQFRERIPRDVLGRVRGRVLDIPVAGEHVRVRVTAKAEAIKVSLRTRDPGEAKARHAVVSTYLSNVYRYLRATSPRSLTPDECGAIAGEFYRGWASSDMAARMMRITDGDAEARAVWEVQGKNWEADPKREEKLSPLLDQFLMARGERIDERSRSSILAQAAAAKGYAYARQERRAGGDHSPDPAAVRFPALSVMESANGKGEAGRQTATKLFKSWLGHPDQKAITPSTLASYDAVFNRLRAFLVKRHGAEPPVCDLTRADIRAYIDMRSDEDGVKPKTINAVDLGAINAVFNWAVEQEMLTTGNPAARIKRKARKDADEGGRKSLNDAEKAAILKQSLDYTKGERESAKLAAAKRWVPWLMAYTGTRVGEMAQLRKTDVVKFDGRWAIAVSKDAGTVKTKGAWHIPIHPHLIEQGFLDFVTAAPDGHLFLTPRPDLYRLDAPPSRTKDPRGILGPLQSLKNKLAAFAKDALGSGPAPAPNHGWRHRFKAQARKNGIDKEVRDAFADHASGDVAGEYGKDELFSAMVAALDKIPRYKLG